MLDFFRAFPWFLKTLRYRDSEEIIAMLHAEVILPAQEKAKELISSQQKCSGPDVARRS
jgi:hypothetical protein